jgi:pilus assembly protein CpaC
MKLPLIACFSTLLAFTATPGWAQQRQPRAAVTPEARTATVPERTTTVSLERGVQAGSSLVLPLNKSRVMRVSSAIGKIATGNADIVDVVALTDRSFYVLGKGLGTTNIALYGTDQELLAVVDVSVTIDVDGVRAALRSLLPGERIEVRPVNDTISLGGVMSSAAKTHQALEIAQRFSVKGGTVIDNMSVRGNQQVMLQVKVAEMDRTVASAFGFHPAALIGSASNLGGAGLLLSSLNTTNLGTSILGAAGSIGKNSFSFSDVLEALEQRGSVKVLAEPNLVALSGDTASFLAGGEFPIPVAQTPAVAGAAGTITVAFKPFGVSLAFTPTVLEGDLINLIVLPEVSEIDKANSFSSNGFTIPGISTRRVKTSVEVRDGESFAIAGLLSESFSDQVQGIPGINNLPILGALFRDSNFKRKQSELVIIVTPRLVRPTLANTLRAPTDSFVPPTERDIYFNGKTEAPHSAGGGLAGRYGHIIR